VRQPTLKASWITGASKKARETRAKILSVLAAQNRLCILSEPKEGNTHTIYAVIFGDEKSDGRFAEALAQAFTIANTFVNEEGAVKALMADCERMQAEIDRLRTIHIQPGSEESKEDGAGETV
jgi:hypothetical protein